MYSEAEDSLDDVFVEAFETNHPAMIDWATIKFELKDLRAKVAMQNTANNSESTKSLCIDCTNVCPFKMMCDSGLVISVCPSATSHIS